MMPNPETNNPREKKEENNLDEMISGQLKSFRTDLEEKKRTGIAEEDLKLFAEEKRAEIVKSLIEKEFLSGVGIDEDRPTFSGETPEEKNFARESFLALKDEIKTKIDEILTAVLEGKEERSEVNEVSPVPVERKIDIDFPEIEKKIKDLKDGLEGKLPEVMKLINKLFNLLRAKELLPDKGQDRIDEIANQINCDEIIIQMVEEDAGEYSELMKEIIEELKKAHTINKKTLVVNQPPIPDKGPIIVSPSGEETASSWRVAYHEALSTRSDEDLLKYIQDRIANLEKEEGAFAKQATFSKDKDGGMPFDGFRMYLKEELDRRPNIKPDIKYYEKFFEHRLRIADILAEFGVSKRMSADFRAAAENKWPDYGHFDHHFFVGTATREKGERYKHFKVVRAVTSMITDFLDEQYDFTIKKSDEYKGVGIAPTGFHSFGRGKWMSGEGTFDKTLIARIKKEYLEKNVKRENGEYIKENGNYLLKDGQDISDAELTASIRIGFTQFALLGGRGEMFMSYYAIGMSPPNLGEFGFQVENYPRAKEMALACKKPIEIPFVVMGGTIDKKWLLRMATKNGIYHVVSKTDVLNKGGLTANNKLWNLAGPSVPLLTEPEKFAHFIDKLDESTVEKILLLIQDGESINNNAYKRFRNLLRSIAISEAKRKWLQIYYPDRKTQLLDKNGNMNNSSHSYLAPLIEPPRVMVLGSTEFKNENDDNLGFYAEQGTEFKSVYIKLHDNVKAFREKVFSSAPDIKDKNQTEAILILADDFYQCLNMTSGMKAQQSMVNWKQVMELFEYRLAIIFATYRKAGFDNVLEIPLESIGDELRRRFRLGSSEIPPVSLVQALLDKVESSGQVMSPDGEGYWLTDMKGSLYDGPDNKSYNFEDYLKKLLLVNPKEKGLVSFKDLENGIYDGVEGRRKIASQNWKEYEHLRKKYGAQEDTLDDFLLPIGAVTERAEQKKEVEEKGKK